MGIHEPMCTGIQDTANTTYLSLFYSNRFSFRHFFLLFFGLLNDEGCDVLGCRVAGMMDSDGDEIVKVVMVMVTVLYVYALMVYVWIQQKSYKMIY